MTGSKKSLHDIYGLRIDIYLMWFYAATALIAGLSFPVITFTELMIKKSTYSVLGGVVDLMAHGEYVLAIAIFLFSVVFPIIKLTALLCIWFAKIQETERNSLLDKLSSLGKWSMLDVYVLAMTIVIAKSSALLRAEPQMGIYFFGTSVLVSIFASMRIEKLSKNPFTSH